MRKVIAQKNDDLGSVHCDEILTLRAAAHRLGWHRKSIVEAKRAGLRTVRVGRFDLVLGKWIWEFLEGFDNKQNDKPF
jgi:hypothetical protein